MQIRPISSTLELLALSLAMGLTAIAQVPANSPASPQVSQQNPATSAGGQQQARPQGQMSIDDELQLTPDQKQKIAAIVDDERKQMTAIRDDTSLSMDQKQQKAAQIREVGSPKIRAILTQEQLQKLAAIQAREQQQPANSNPSSPQAPQR